MYILRIQILVKYKIIYKIILGKIIRENFFNLFCFNLWYFLKISENHFKEMESILKVLELYIL